MNTAQILKLLSHDSFASQLNPSVQPINHFLVNSINKPSVTIINYDNCDEPGSHWVCVYCTTSGSIEFFDSYGIRPIIPKLMTKLQANSTKTITYNSFALQGLSTVCGQYCVIFTLLRARGYSFHDVISMFRNCKSKSERDYVVNMVFNRNYSESVGKYFFAYG